MQDPTTFPPLKPPFPEQEQLKCPRCDSTNTKFCYYNNYNLSQPRHFCKNCRRYWTKGGILRNIPVGGGSRKNTKKTSTKKGSSSSSSSPSSSSSLPSSSSSLTLEPTSTAQTTVPDLNPAPAQSNLVDKEKQGVDISGSFSSLLGTSGPFGSLVEGLNSNGGVKGLPISAMGDKLNSDPLVNSGEGRNTMQLQRNSNSESFLGMQIGGSTCWNDGSEWSAQAIYSSGLSLSVEAEREKTNYFA